MNRILCPIDLSDISPHVVDHAVLLARWYGAEVTVLHVASPIRIPVTDVAVAGAGLPVTLTEEEIQEARQRVVSCLASASGGGGDVRIASGQPATQIVELARALPADLIVMGTHGSGGFVHLVLGSIAEKVLRQATCPVLTVPPHARTTSRLPFKRILCPLDFSDPSLSALEFAFSLAKEGAAELTILHVFEWPDEPRTTRPIATPEFRQALERDAIARLNQLVPEAAKEWCFPTMRVAHGKPYREILGAADADDSDLIVMGVHGRNALDLMLFGSTTNQVVRRATCPVLTRRS
jgi:nucleotide-binding universal stress UspA family protein